MRIFRILLFPLVPFYYLVTWLRNKLYDFNIKKSTSYPFPVVAVGNLSVGGTGKTPMIEFLIRFLKDDYKIATLSRGYGRKTKGYRQVERHSNANEVGDEPLQFKNKFPEIQVAVDEDRREGIHLLRSVKEVPQVILLDDAYQHRRVKAGFYILLTAYHQLYVDDFVLPTGNLRESSSGAKRAQCIIVTKCPQDLSLNDQESIIKKLKPNHSQKVYFSTISYSDYLYNKENEKRALSTLENTKFSLLTGIANPKPLLDYYKNKGLNFDHLEFKDHHNFTKQEIDELRHKELIITTEKDFMRLSPYLSANQLWYQPVKMHFLNNSEDFQTEILDFIENT